MIAARHAVAVALALSSLGLPVRLLALEGRTLGTLLHSDGPADEDVLRFLYDVGGYQTINNDTNLRLRMSLDYFSLLEQSNQDFWRARFFGQLRAPQWRVDGQFTPWQRTAPGSLAARQRVGELGLHLMPRRLPRLDADWSRTERDLSGGRSSSDTKRVQLAYGTGGLGGEVGFRRIDATPIVGAIAVASRTDEWRGTLQGVRGGRHGSVQASYDALLSRYRMRERRRELGTQRLTFGGSLAPTRRLTLGVSFQDRWGYLRDNGLQTPGSVDELSLGASVAFRPIPELDLQASREYRRSQALSGHIVSDYLQLEANFRRAMTRHLHFQTGYLTALDLASSSGSVPNNSGYVLLGGRLRAGLEARAEARASRPEGAGVSGLQWRNLLQLRTLPSKESRFEVTWQRSDLPRLFGVGQTDRELHLLGSYDPFPGASLVASWRRSNGVGRVRRAEQQWNLTGSWSVSERSNLSANWSRRLVSQPAALPADDVLGIDAAFWLPGEWQTHATYQRAARGPQAKQRSYGLSLEKRF